jgi:hypothetical protein
MSSNNACCIHWFLESDMPPNSSRDPKVGLRVKQWKKKKVGARSLIHNTSGGRKACWSSEMGLG